MKKGQITKAEIRAAKRGYEFCMSLPKRKINPYPAKKDKKLNEAWEEGYYEALVCLM